ncbi:signal peptidase II [Patescibacteria group bacterium]|nr:MAG: signal peptidase II [Patescibacteria group bacterium]
MLQKIRWRSLLTGGFFLIIDQFLKWFSLDAWTEKKIGCLGLPPHQNFWCGGWEPFANYGAAFGLPVPNRVIVILTIPALFLIGYLFAKQRPPLNLPLSKGEGIRLFALAILFFGALSNLIDRLAYGYVVDYLRALTGIINLSDILIVLGLLFFLFGKGIPLPTKSGSE